MEKRKSQFTRERVLAWLSYFARQADLELEQIKIMDISVKEKNLLPAVEANKAVLAFADGGHQGLFYNMWAAGFGACDLWLKTGWEPEGAVECRKVKDMIDREISGPTVMLFVNDQARSTYKIGLKNDDFSRGSIRYVGSEIRAVIMSMLHVDARDTICIISGESIAVEAAIMASEGTIIAVEGARNDAKTLEENMEKFGLHNVKIIPDVKRETMAGLPVPSLAFIVATDDLEEEIGALLAVNPRMQFIIYTLELGILAKVPEIFQKHEIGDMEVIQIALSKLNSKNVFVAQPVPWLISGQAKG